MKEKRNLHLKVQELCDCYATTDPLKEMSEIKDETDVQEASLKWIALAVLHGINNNAKSITISRSKDGEVQVTAKYRESQLPSPGSTIGQNIIQAVREIGHLEGDKGKIPLSLGIRESSIDLTLKARVEEGKERVTIKFPG
ncbi:MAG: hypothetical protein JRH18_16750 [Deltaproteobacteria bacterium]|nr:hypothetical protein [Deltaproteobacteria bacterium]MBW1961975.1 hypothetical protein [Deltaproteobacteria bacterium]MBW1995519.1 hypothetical protein [Deltaproteobacteria bacterium]MBW2153306.1 hypothetical protein [Deltaproteobacteria bacterium]